MSHKKNNLTEDQLDELIENLKDTSKTLEEGLADEFGMDDVRLTTKQIAYINNEIFRCDSCETWCSKEDMSHSSVSNNFCDNCSPSFDMEDND